MNVNNHAPKGMQRLLTSKSRHPLTLALVWGLAFWLIFGSFSHPTTAYAATINVNSGSLNGWYIGVQPGTSSTSADSIGSFVNGPTGQPLGLGSAKLETVTSNGRTILVTQAYSSTLLSQFSQLQYHTNKESGGATFGPVTLQLVYDLDTTVNSDSLGTAADDFDGTLVFEPYYLDNTATPLNTWETWDAATQDAWWSTGSGPLATTCVAASPATMCTLSQIVGLHPNIAITNNPASFIGFKVGSGWGASVNYVDAFSITINGNNTVWDFGPVTQCTTTCYVDAVNGNDANGGTNPTTDAKKTVQAGVTTVQAGGTVIVAAGNYTEQITINKAVTVTGAGQGATNIISPATVNPVSILCTFPGSSVTPSDIRPVIMITGTTATIQNVTVDGNGQGNANNAFRGIAFYNSAGTVTNSTITRFRSTPADGVQSGEGLSVCNEDDVVRTVNVTNNIVNDFQKTGVKALGDNLTFNVQNNVITGLGSVNFIAQNAIQITDGVIGNVTGNQISNVNYSNQADFFTGSGILLIGTGGTTIIASNTFTDTEIGILASGEVGYSTALSISNNTMQWVSPIPTDTIGIYMDDGFSGFSGPATATITGNLISRFNNGIYLNDFNSDGIQVGATINYNRIVFNATNGLLVDGSNTGTPNASAENNWWGCNAGPGNSGCDAVSAINGGTADFNPWLQLRLSAIPSAVNLGGNATLTADLSFNSNGVQALPGVPNNTPVSFSGGTLGTVAPTNTILTNSLANTTFTGTTVGAGFVSTTVDNQTVTLAFTVNNAAPIYSSNPAPGATIDFGTVQIGTAITRTIVISNTGGGTLTVSAPGGLGGAFSVSPNTAQNIAAGAANAVTVNIVCTPTVLGLTTATLTYTTNDTTQTTVSYTLNCTGSPPPNVSFFRTITPARLYDSRPSGTNPTNPPFGTGAGPISTGQVRTIKAHGSIGIPTTAKAILANITIVNAQAGGNLRAFPANFDDVNTSSVNWYQSPQGLGARTVASFAIIGLDANGDFKIRTTGTTNFIVDVFGYLTEETTGAGVYQPLQNGVRPRLYDSRASGTNNPNPPFGVGTGQLKKGDAPRRIKVTGTGSTQNIPASATAIILNVTLANSVGSGYFTVYPAGGVVPGTVSTVNWQDWRNSGTNIPRDIANMAIVPVSATGEIEIIAGGTDGSGADLIIDTLGYIDPAVGAATGFHVPLSSQLRLYDSRQTEPVYPGSATKGTLASQAIRAIIGRGILSVPSNAQSVLVRITTVEVGGGGFLAMFQSPPWPGNSSVNTNGANQQIGNLAIVNLDTLGAFQVLNGSGLFSMGFVIDIIAYIT